MLIPTLCWTLGSTCLPILLLQQGLLQSKFKANPILFALHLHLEIPPTSQVHGEMLQLDQTRSVTMILKGKDMEWWIDTTAYTAWRQQIPSLQGFELIVMGTSQRFHCFKSDVERLCCWSFVVVKDIMALWDTKPWSELDLHFRGIHKDYRIDFIKILWPHDFQ